MYFTCNLVSDYTNLVLVGEIPVNTLYNNGNFSLNFINLPTYIYSFDMLECLLIYIVSTSYLGHSYTYCV